MDFDGFRRYFESGFRFGSDVSGEYRAELYFAYHFTYHVGDYKVFPEKLRKAFGDERAWTSTQNSFVQERLSGMSLIQVFNRQEAEFKKFDDINVNLKAALLKTVFYFFIVFSCGGTDFFCFIGLILFVAGYNALTARDISRDK